MPGGAGRPQLKGRKEGESTLSTKDRVVCKFVCNSIYKMFATLRVDVSSDTSGDLLSELLEAYPTVSQYYFQYELGDSSGKSHFQSL